MTSLFLSVHSRRYAFCAFEKAEEVGNVLEAAFKTNLLYCEIAAAQQQVAGYLKTARVDGLCYL